jgi:hypothetical protein
LFSLFVFAAAPILTDIENAVTDVTQNPLTVSPNHITHRTAPRELARSVAARRDRGPSSPPKEGCRLRAIAAIITTYQAVDALLAWFDNAGFVE